MKYITIKRYKRTDLGDRKAVNLPYGTDVEERGGVLYHGDTALCNDHSAVMREYFARNDDGRGLERGKLSQAIVKRLELQKGETPEERSKRWAAVWDDALCLKYRKKAQADFFLWSIEFYNAPIEDLQYIAALVGA